MQEQVRVNPLLRLAVPTIAVAILAMLCLMMGSESAYAGGGRYITAFKGNVTTVYMKKGDIDYYSDLKNGLNGKKISAAKSSNKKVATVKVKTYDNGMTSLLVTKKKAGTTKITYKLDGKKKTVKLKVVKWKNPVKTFKVGSKNYASKFKKSAGSHAASSVAGKTVKVEAASGWKVKRIVAYTNNGVKIVRNGKKTPADTGQVVVALKNTKTKAVETVAVYHW